MDIYLPALGTDYNTDKKHICKRCLHEKKNAAARSELHRAIHPIGTATFTGISSNTTAMALHFEEKMLWR